MTATCTRLLLLALLLTPSAACFSRFTMRQADFEQRVLADTTGESKIRLYLSHRLVIVRDDLTYPGEEIHASIDKRGRRKYLREIIGRRTAGKIVAADQENGRRLLWIAFDDECTRRDCAYGFALGDDGAAFRLTRIPHNPVFERERAYLRLHGLRRGLRRGYLASLGEANPVFRAQGPRGRLVPLELQFLERRRRKHVAIDIKTGVERNEDNPTDFVPPSSGARP